MEDALSFALSEAAKAGQWAIVARLAKEFEAQQLLSSPNVVSIKEKQILG
jgi:hypothetical protein